MKAFTIVTADFLAALSLAAETLAPKETIPILSFMLLESADGHLRITATSHDLSFTTSMEAITDEPLTTCVKIQQVQRLLRAIEAEVVTFKQEGSVAVITTDTLRYRLLTMPTDQYPALVHAESPQTPISGPLLASMLSAVAFAAETNPNGEARWKALELEAKGGRLSVTGCCGSQLANAETEFDGEFYALVPERAISLLSKFALKSESLILAMNGQLLTAQSSIGMIDIRLSAYEWPEWRQLIGEQYQHTVQCDTEPLTIALRRLLQFTDNLIVQRIAFEIAADRMIATCTSPERGEGREGIDVTCPSVNCPSTNGDSISTAMDGKRLMALLRQTEGVATWELAEGMPSRFTFDGERVFKFQCVQLPMR